MEFSEEVQKSRQVEVSSILFQEKFSDVKFVCGAEMTLIYGNRSALAGISAVFRTMFFGEMKGDEECFTVNIPDVDPKAFECIIRFSAGIDPKINEGNCVQVKLITEKYQICSLDPFLQKYIETSLNVEKAFFKIYGQAVKSSNTNLVTQCLRSLEDFSNFSMLISSEGFLQLPLNGMNSLLQSDNLKVHEENLWEACLVWADHQTKRIGMRGTKRNANGEPTQPNSELQGKIRKHLLRQIKKSFRFPLMSPEFIVQKVYPEDVLSEKEYADILSDMISPSPLQRSSYSSNRRIPLTNLRLADAINIKTLHEVPPFAYIVEGAGTSEVNGKYVYSNTSGMIPKYCKKLPKGRELTLFRCVVRSQVSMWFISEVNKDYPGTNLDTDYYRNRSVNQTSPPTSGWTMKKSDKGVRPFPTLRAEKVADDPSLSPKFVWAASQT